MQRRILITVAALIVAFAALVVTAGNLEPPGPPGPTMRTLDEIYDLLVGLVDGQQAATDPQSVGAEPRLIGCMAIIVGSAPLTVTEPNDIADPICGDPAFYDPPRTRVLGAAFIGERPPPDGGGMQTPIVIFEPFTITRNFDQLTPLLLQGAIANTEYDEVQIDWFRVDPDEAIVEMYQSFLLEDTRVGDVELSLQPSVGGVSHLDTTTFFPTTVTVTWNDGGAVSTFDPLFTDPTP